MWCRQKRFLTSYLFPVCQNGGGTGHGKAYWKNSEKKKLMVCRVRGLAQNFLQFAHLLRELVHSGLAPPEFNVQNVFSFLRSRADMFLHAIPPHNVGSFPISPLHFGKIRVSW